MCSFISAYSRFFGEDNPEFMAALASLVQILCATSSSTLATFLDSIVTDQSLPTKQKISILSTIVEHESFSGFYMHKIVKSLIHHHSKNKEESLSLAINIAAKYVDLKVEETEDDANNRLLMEFPCSRPSDPKTIPNRMLALLKERVEAEELFVEDTNCIILALVAVRPLDQDLAVETFVLTMATLLSASNEQLSESLDMVYLCTRFLSTLMCPNEFMEQVVDNLFLLSKLDKHLDCENGAKTLAHVFFIADAANNPLWMQKKVVRPLQGQLLIQTMVKNMSSTSTTVRLCLLRSLNKIYPKDEAFRQMLEAENTAADIKTCRDRIKHLTNLAWDSSAMQNTDSPILVREAVVRFLLAQLSVNFSLLWQPCITVIQTHGQGGIDADMMWDTFYEIFKDANVKAAALSVKEKSVKKSAKNPG